MKYYGKPTTEKVEHRLCEYIRCDSCNKKIVDKEKYFNVMTGHHDWGNDSCDSIKYLDICEKCLDKYVGNYFKETKDSYTAYINVEPEVFYKNHKYYGDYDKYEDKLVENDILESQV